MGLALGHSTVNAASPVSFRNVKVSTAEGHTRFEADVSHPIGFSVTAQTNPDRVLIELPEVEFDLPSGAGRSVSGVIRAYRYGLSDEGKSRVVLETKGPVVINSSAVTPAGEGKPAHLIIDLITTSQKGFADTLARDHGEASPIETTAIAPIVASAAPRKLTIAIDPGHGGIDPGAIGPGQVREKDVVFAFALELKKTLLEGGAYDVILTRTDDSFVQLEDRVKVAREKKADLFVALHADTLRDATVRGTTVYTVSEKASDAVAEDLAQRENRSDIIAGMDLGRQTDDVANVLINLAQRESKNQAMFFAKKAIAEIKPITETTSKPIRSAAFVVLKAPDVPSVLVELGYLSNRKDEALLTSPLWRETMAIALAKAIDRYFAPAASVSLK